MDNQTQITNKEKLSEYRKKLKDIQKLYNAVNIYAHTNEKYYSKTYIKLHGCEVFIKHLGRYLTESDFVHFDLTYKGILIFLSESIEIYANMQNI